MNYLKPPGARGMLSLQEMLKLLLILDRARTEGDLLFCFII